MTNSLIDVSTLHAAFAAGEPIVVLDIRFTAMKPDAASYEAGHIPSALFVDLDRVLAAPAGPGGRHPLPRRQALTSALEQLGITPSSRVVVYDDCRSLAASRAWWCLRWAGCEEVAVLDGGLSAWQAAGHAIETGAVSVTPVDAIWPDEGHVSSVPVGEVDAARHMLVDVRTPERFRGEHEPIDPVAGHIPGAVNCPMGNLMAEDGTFLPSARLREQLGPFLSGRTVAYCGSGVTAAQFALAATIIDEKVDIFAGSWSEWITDSSRPIATGD